MDDIRGWNFADKDNNPADDNGHGTHVTGIIAAVGNNGIGVAGVAWNAKIMALKSFRADGSGLTSDAIPAIAYANLMGADVINNSWGGVNTWSLSFPRRFWVLAVCLIISFFIGWFGKRRQ